MYAIINRKDAVTNETIGEVVAVYEGWFDAMTKYTDIGLSVRRGYTKFFPKMIVKMAPGWKVKAGDVVPFADDNGLTHEFYHM